MYRFLLAALVLALAGVGSSLAQQHKVKITVAAGTEDAKNVPILVPLEISPKLAEARHVRLTEGGSKELLLGQWTAPSLLTEEVRPKDKALVRRDLHFVMSEVKAGTTRTFSLEPVDFEITSKLFRWSEAEAGVMELSLSRGKRILRYMYSPYDNSSEAKRDKTYKVFHHLYDPAGKRLVTNGGQSDPGSEGKKLLYPHHRGLMFAFNKITYGNGKTADTWHAKPRDTHQSHEGFLGTEEGMVLGRHRVAVAWHGPDQDVFATEERELTVYGTEGGTLVEFASRLKTTDGKVRLDGDPQHAGFQFRAANDVADKTAKQTYYLRPDGKGKRGETRNWDPKNKGPVNLPWDAMSFVLDGQRYTVAYIDHPQNPGEKRYSERDYGRFGCYFEYDLSPERPLVIHHRIWLQNGEMTGEQVQALSTNFVTPPRVSVK